MQLPAYFRASGAMAALLILSSTTAMARPASVFMLQFGSFESQQEADERLKGLKSRHGGILGGFPSRVLQVSLPDGLTVYRTQAGPVADRAAAQGLCGQLASAGDECYVVETAMLQPPVDTVGQSVAGLAEQAKAAPSASREAAGEALKQMVAAQVSPETPTLRALPTPEASAPVVAPVVPKATTRAPSERSSSFWSYLNPFSEDEGQTAPAAPVKQPAAAPKIAKAETPSRTETTPVSEEKTSAAAETSTRPVVVLPSFTASEERTSAAPAPLPALPPPPVLSERAMKALETERAAAPTPPPSLDDLSPDARPAAAAAETVGVLPATPPVKVAPLDAGAGEVKVGEAQRVPLSDTPQPMFVPSGSPIAPPDASTPVYPPGITPPPPPLAAPEAALPPSYPMGKTQWAEIGYFENAPAALAFWDAFRHSHPDFPVVRVRVTQPYVSKLKGDDRVQLRVGPFAKQASVAYLCRSVTTPPEGVKPKGCRSMTDLGISSAQPGPRGRVLMGEANAALALQQSTRIPDRYWLQLGTFPTLSQAREAWDALKKKHGNALPGDAPDISVPALGSAGAAPSYRLRSGPFADQASALAACNRVRNIGGTCLVSAN